MMEKEESKTSKDVNNVNNATSESLMESTIDIQKRVYFNKVNHGFNAIDIPKEFCFLYGEVAETFDAWKHQSGLDLKFADIAIHLLWLAEITGIDLGRAINKKIGSNEHRTYEVGSQEWYDSLSTEMEDYFADGMK